MLPWHVCVCVFVCIHVRDMVLKLQGWIPHGKIAGAYFWFSLNYLSLLNYGPLTNKGMKFCKCRISKSIIARNLKLVMLMGIMMIRIFDKKLKIICMIFFELLPFFKIFVQYLLFLVHIPHTPHHPLPPTLRSHPT